MQKAIEVRRFGVELLRCSARSATTPYLVQSNLLGKVGTATTPLKSFEAHVARSGPEQKVLEIVTGRSHDRKIMDRILIQKSIIGVTTNATVEMLSMVGRVRPRTAVSTFRLGKLI